MFAAASLLTGCKANFPVAQQTGKEDMAYLLFVGQKEYSGKEVQVTIDNADRLRQKSSNRRKPTEEARNTASVQVPRASW